MALHVGGLSLALAQMGPDFIILKQALQAALPPLSGSITLTVDGEREEIPVAFPQGIPAGQRRMALPVEAEALVAV